MKHFLFLTLEGYTFDKNHRETSNIQVLGSASGEDLLEAFKLFKINDAHVLKFAYKNLIAVEYIGDFIHNLEL